MKHIFSWYIPRNCVKIIKECARNNFPFLEPFLSQVQVKKPTASDATDGTKTALKMGIYFARFLNEYQHFDFLT